MKTMGSLQERSGRQGFNSFSTLLKRLGESNGTLEKSRALQEYFNKATPADKAWALGLFSGRRPRRLVKTSLLASWVYQRENLPEWLFRESYLQVGDLAETLALLTRTEGGTGLEGDLSDIMHLLKELGEATEEEKRLRIRSLWDSMDGQERFVFNKLITGGFRVGVSAQSVTQALAGLYGTEPSVMAHRLSGQWDPGDCDFEAMVRGEASEDDLSRPYPFFLAHPIETGPDALGEPSDWHAEWKWDGIRGQIIRRAGKFFVWSRGEELITEKFPEFSEIFGIIPDGTVLDGEILAMRDGSPLPFSVLQTRIGRTRIGKKILQDAPVGFMAFDLLEFGGEDWRNRTFRERREKLAGIVGEASLPVLRLSEGIGIETWVALAGIRSKAREKGSEGLMLKRMISTYQAGRRRGDWWKWKIDPMTIDAVLVYAQKGHGRRSSLYTDYTFAVRDGDRLVTFAKAYSGLTDKEFQTVDAFVKRNSLEKFGPVRTVRPELVFEIAFEGIMESKRHKSGIALRFPRMSRWRTDKKPEDINTLDDLREMLRTHGNPGAGSEEGTTADA
jgi:DNA ligase-1